MWWSRSGRAGTSVGAAPRQASGHSTSTGVAIPKGANVPNTPRRPIANQIAEPVTRTVGPRAVQVIKPPAPAKVSPGAIVAPASGMISPGVIIAPASQVAMQTPTGTINVDATIYREWVSLASHTTVSGGDVQTYLGSPLRLSVTRSGASGLYFERGVILLRPDNRCFAVYGAIYVHYQALIALENPPAGFNLGLPVAEEEAIPNGPLPTFYAAAI